MNIVHTISSLSRNAGGLYSAVSSLASSISQHPVHLRVLAYDDELTDVDIHAWDAVDSYPIKAKKVAGLHWGGKADLELARLKPDLVHGHGLWTKWSFENREYCRQHSIPYFISVHGMLSSYALNVSRWKKIIASHWFEQAHLRDASCLQALSNTELNQFREYGLSNPVSVIPNGIYLPQYTQYEAAPWHEDYRSNGRKALFYMGRLHPLKGLPLLLKAWARMRKAFPAYADEWFLAIAGWDELSHRKELETLISQLNLEQDVIFLGTLLGTDKESALSLASAFILPSFSEAMPMSVLEALSYKLPVLMTPVCNLPEAYAAGAALEIQHDELSMSAQLIYLMEMSDEERRKMGEKGFELVKSRFTWNEVSSKMISVYDWILGGGEPPECIQFLR